MSIVPQVSLGGNLFVTGNGLVAGECCCPGTTTTSVNPCTGGKVPLKVTISWTGTPPELTGGTYTWLGHDFSNGQTILVCPTTYYCGKTDPTTLTPVSNFTGGGNCSFVKQYNYLRYSNLWSIADMNLQAVYFNSQYRKYYGTHTNSITCNVTTQFTNAGSIWKKSLTASPLGGRSIRRTKAIIGGFFTTTNSNQAGLSTDTITPAANFAVTPAPIFIDDDILGQLTTTSGVTIAWTKGVPSEWCGA